MELINAPLVAMVPKQIGLLKIEIEQMSVKYFAIKAHLNPLVYHYCCIIRLFCDPTEISVSSTQESSAFIGFSLFAQT